MKKLTIVIASSFLFICTAFASPRNSSAGDVAAAFNKDFAGVSTVGWELSGEFYFASFIYDNKAVTAAYDESGVLLGISRKIDLGQLPLVVSNALRENYSHYKIGLFATEVVHEGQTFYYVTAEGKSKKLTLKCFLNGEIFIEKKERKQCNA